VGAGAAGVSWSRQEKAWRARINFSTGDGERQQRQLGGFANEVEAALAYDQAAREHHGNKAQLNFPEPTPLQSQGPTKRVRREQVRPNEVQQGRLIARATIPFLSVTCGL
jgi:hypothetical protein